MKTIVVVIGSLVIFFGVALALDYSTSPIPTGEASGKIDLYAEPLQTPCDEPAIEKNADSMTFTIVPKASYEIRCLVICKVKYDIGAVAKLSPMDICAVWGKMGEREYREHISCVEAGRACIFFSEGVSLEKSYIHSHIANMHLIPANENVLKAIRSIRTDDNVVLEGFLVQVYCNGELIWSSSMTRDDDKCEVFYVTGVRIGNELYG